MAFPLTPNDGDTHTIGTIKYAYDAAAVSWKAVSGGIPIPVEAERLITAASDPVTKSTGDPLEEGDFYYNTADDAIKTYDGTAWAAISTTPEFIRTNTTNPSTRLDGTALQSGDFYYNTASENLYIYDGASWRLNSWYNLVEPRTNNPTARDNGESLQEGDIYYNTANDELRAYDGAAWNSIGSDIVVGDVGTYAFLAHAGNNIINVGQDYIGLPYTAVHRSWGNAILLATGGGTPAGTWRAVSGGAGSAFGGDNDAAGLFVRVL